MNASTEVKSKESQIASLEDQLIRSMQKVEDSMVRLNSRREQLMSKKNLQISRKPARDLSLWDNFFLKCKALLKKYLEKTMEPKLTLRRSNAEGLEQIILKNFKQVFCKLGEKYFFLKAELAKSAEKKRQMERWLKEFFSRKKTLGAMKDFEKHFLKKFGRKELQKKSYKEVCREVRSDLLTEVNSFRERLQHSHSKGLSDSKKLQRKIKKYKEKAQQLSQISGYDLKKNLGIAEISEFVKHLNSDKGARTLAKFVFLVGLTWQSRFLMQELFELNSSKQKVDEMTFYSGLEGKLLKKGTFFSGANLRQKTKFETNFSNKNGS